MIAWLQKQYQKTPNLVLMAAIALSTVSYFIVGLSLLPAVLIGFTALLSWGVYKNSAQNETSHLHAQYLPIAKHSKEIFKRFYQNKQIITPLLKDYPRYNIGQGHIFSNADFIVRHGAMHVSRVAMNIVLFANLYRKHGDADALALSQQDIVMCQIAALYHDLGRLILVNDLGKDTQKAETLGKQHCYQYLKKSFPDVSHQKIKQISDAIVNKDGNHNDIFCRLLQNADCLDVLRADDWAFDKKYLNFYQENKRNPAAIKDLDKMIEASKQYLISHGDSPQNFVSLSGKKLTGKFSLKTKRKYETNPNCFTLLEQKLQEFDALNQLYHNGKLVNDKNKPRTLTKLYTQKMMNHKAKPAMVKNCCATKFARHKP